MLIIYKISAKYFSSSEASFSPCVLLALVQLPLGVGVVQEPCLPPILGFSPETDVSDGDDYSFIYHKPPVVRDILP